MRSLPLVWLVLTALALAGAGLFFRAESGPEAIPFVHPLLAILAVTVLLMAVRILKPLLDRNSDDHDAD